jgi:glycosyltransferase involved in cell wall biosynthesis
MTHRSFPIITIIIAVYNGIKTLRQCIDSVSNQTYPNTQLIIIDGGSNDGTVDLLNENQNKISYWSSEPDKGIYNAWNKGLKQAKGDWICFLGADDYFWDDYVLEGMVGTLCRLSDDFNVAYGEVMLLTEDDQTLYKIGKPWHHVKHLFPKSMSIPHPGLMHRNSLFIKHGHFDESFRIAGDYEFLLRELKDRDAVFIPILIAGIRQGGVSCNSGNTLSLLKEVRNAQIMHGFYIPSFLWLLAFLRIIIRKSLWFMIGEIRARKLLDLGRRIYGLPAYWTRT